ncbi:MAG: Gfo/Idh/MocA family oxidoreductase, partial [Rubrobacteraceae bacterium]|nr:Gfo/Idh/MocA family oxidoreductase [Rubrobacteraceae bacterium]
MKRRKRRANGKSTWKRGPRRARRTSRGGKGQVGEENKVKVAIVGSGNIGTDLMYKLLEKPGHMELALLAGIDPDSEGLKRARDEGVGATHEGIEKILEDEEIEIVFDATSAKAHVRHARMLREAGKVAVDLTPA